MPVPPRHIPNIIAFYVHITLCHDVQTPRHVSAHLLMMHTFRSFVFFSLLKDQFYRYCSWMKLFMTNRCRTHSKDTFCLIVILRMLQCPMCYLVAVQLEVFILHTRHCIRNKAMTSEMKFVVFLFHRCAINKKRLIRGWFRIYNESVMKLFSHFISS